MSFSSLIFSLSALSRAVQAIFSCREAGGCRIKVPKGTSAGCFMRRYQSGHRSTFICGMSVITAANVLSHSIVLPHTSHTQPSYAHAHADPAPTPPEPFRYVPKAPMTCSSPWFPIINEYAAAHKKGVWKTWEAPPVQTLHALPLISLACGRQQEYGSYIKTSGGPILESLVRASSSWL